MPLNPTVRHNRAQQRRRLRDANVQHADQLEDLAARAAALAISDDGPDVEGQPNRLFADRQDFQNTRPALIRTSLNEMQGDITNTFAYRSPPSPHAAPQPLSPVPPLAPPTRPEAVDGVTAEPTTPRRSGLRPRSVPSSSTPPTPPQRPAPRMPIRAQRLSSAVDHISTDLAQLENLSHQVQPTLDHFYSLRAGLVSVQATIKDLPKVDKRTKATRDQWAQDVSRLNKVLETWRLTVALPKEPAHVATSK